MPTPGERIATIEAEVHELRRDVAEIRALIDGGNGVEWKRSVRGRLHELRNDVDALLALRRAGIHLVSRGWRTVAGICLLATAAAPYALYFLTR